MRSLYLILAVSLLYSCDLGNTPKEPFQSLLANCNQVKIIFFNKGDTLHFETKDSTGIHILTHLSEEHTKEATSDCPVTGELRYFNENDTLLTAQFSTEASGSRQDCNHVTYYLSPEYYTHQMNDRAIKLLNEIFRQSLNTPQ